MESLLVQQIINGLIVGSIYCLMAIGLTMIFGVMKISNFAHGDFLMFGAYLAIYSTMYVTGWVGWIGAMFVAAVGVGLLGFIAEAFLFRPLMKRNSDIDVIMLSIGLSIFLANGAHLVFGATPKMLVDPFQSGNVNLFFFSTSLIRILSFLFAISAIIVLQLFLTKTKVGTAIRAVSQNRNALHAHGHRHELHLRPDLYRRVRPGGVERRSVRNDFCVSPTMGALPTLKAFAITIMGGMGSIGAPFSADLFSALPRPWAQYISMDYKNASVSSSSSSSCSSCRKACSDGGRADEE